MSLGAIRFKRNRVNVMFCKTTIGIQMSSLKMNAGLQGQMGTKRLLHIWQTGKCMTNMLSCDNQKQMYYNHKTCNH